MNIPRYKELFPPKEESDRIDSPKKSEIVPRRVQEILHERSSVEEPPKTQERTEAEKSESSHGTHLLSQRTASSRE